MRRLLVTETLDPDGAMHRWCTPDLMALGHEVLPLPTQELVPLLGPDGLAAWILAVAEHQRPDLVLLCPPYDHVSRGTLEALSGLGAKTVAYCFDEPLFPMGGGRRDALAGYGHRFATAPDRVGALPEPASWLRWAASPEAFAQRAVLPAAWRGAIAGAVVLVGRPYRRRVELVEALGERGVPVAVFGHGWGEVRWGGGESRGGAAATPTVGGPLTGPQMHAVLAGAGLVLTTGDWEDQALPMVKYRLLEAAFCGAPQVVQRSPDLADYFETAAEVGAEVAVYETAEELAEVARGFLMNRARALAMAERARVRALREHTWAVRFGELLTALRPLDGVASPGPRSVPPAYVAGLSLIAHDAERRGADRLAEAAFALWQRLAPNPTACAGLSRLGRSAEFAEQGLALLEADPRATSGLYARLPTSVGTGLGQVGFLDPSPELMAMRLGALLGDEAEEAEADALIAADRLIADLCERPELLVATAALLVPTGSGEVMARWRTLFIAALGAETGNRDFDEHRARWREVARG